MTNRSEQYILNKLTKNLSALVVQSTQEIENNFKDYIHELFIEVQYIDNYNKVLESLNIKRFD